MSEEAPTVGVLKAKPWHQSKTMWFNIGSVALLILETINTQPAMLPFDKTQTILWMGLLIAVVNLILRLYTNMVIAGSPGETNHP